MDGQFVDHPGGGSARNSCRRRSAARCRIAHDRNLQRSTDSRSSADLCPSIVTARRFSSRKVPKSGDIAGARHIKIEPDDRRFDHRSRDLRLRSADAGSVQRGVRESGRRSTASASVQEDEIPRVHTVCIVSPMSVSRSLLALLEAAPRHGYDLKRAHDELFRTERPLAYGQVYATLARLLKNGLVTARGNRAGGGAGSQALRHHRRRCQRHRQLAQHSGTAAGVPAEHPLHEGGAGACCHTVLPTKSSTPSGANTWRPCGSSPDAKNPVTSPTN